MPVNLCGIASRKEAIPLKSEEPLYFKTLQAEGKPQGLVNRIVISVG
jgi:hypothetical protein